MLNNFFKLNGNIEEFDIDRMNSQLKTSKHIVNVLFKPNEFKFQKIEGVIFENVSLSKTIIEKCTFKGCTFNDCLFIGTSFNEVSFHKCYFDNCNFFKSNFTKVYCRPEQFRDAIRDRSYSNIAVHLYQQLRENYHSESQREYKNEAEYYFSKWKRNLLLVEAKRNNIAWHKYFPSFVLSFLYDLVLGYGYRLRNLVGSTFLIVFFLTSLNHCFSAYLFTGEESPSIIKSIYFTITTMATLGASGFSPLSEVGYGVVTLNVLIGISILTATLNSVFRKVLR
jgi:Ion channel/Pentapeptide repeats (8 copies)